MIKDKTISDVGAFVPREGTSASLRDDVPTNPQQSAFTAIYREHLARVYRYALSRTGSIPDAQDITSQTFLAAYEQFNRYRGHAQMSTWLLGIAHHKVIDHMRRQKRQISLDQLDADPIAGLTLEVSVEQSLDIQRVIRAMRVLSADRQEALGLHLFGELSIQETADVMRRRYAAVQMLIQRGLADLRTRLQEDK